MVVGLKNHILTSFIEELFVSLLSLYLSLDDLFV